MPNTLAHIGIQGPLNSLLCKGTSPQWMLLGCIIPDIPWISQRLLTLVPGLDPYALRLYSLNQASLFFCLFLAAALALTTGRPLHIFLLLSLNCLLHLLLDATQIKWANGVHLLVPFSWSLLRLDWFWPEHLSCYAATLTGLLFLAFKWRETAASDLQLARPQAMDGPVSCAPGMDKERPRAGKTTIMVCLLLFYGAGPLLFFQQALQADNHFCRALMLRAERSNKEIELDRGVFSLEKKTIRSFTGETFSLRGPLPEKSGLVSVQGHFIDPSTIEVTATHQHNPYRAQASSLGLLLIAALWIHSLILTKFRPQPNTPQQGALP